MNILVTGSLGNISRILVEKLVAAAHNVKVISSDADKVAAIQKLGATPLIGSVMDEDFVVKSFGGSDAVYLMIPPNFSTPDYGKFTATTGNNYANAVRKSGIKHVVNLSSAGSALAGKPPLDHYQNLEMWLDELSNMHVIHLRPGGFYSNFYGSMSMIKYQSMIGNNFPDDRKLIMSHPADIADAAVDAFNTLSFKGKNIKYIVSDVKNGKEIAAILGAAIQKPDLKWVEFTDAQLLQALMQNGFSKDAAQHYIVDMGVAIREGILDRHYQQNTHEVVGKRSFAEFASEFAQVYSEGKD
ncbi:NAD(P)H-binding protein [Dyadobacter sp. OTU695]|uniref:NAD(P)H-binding protein n=1 Tax=Dyadobacter sp. OTU695 TaxID=3043860 RepID=UPI00313DB553